MNNKKWGNNDKGICTCGYWNKDGSLNQNRPVEIKNIHSKDCPSTLCDNTPNPVQLLKALSRI